MQPQETFTIKELSELFKISRQAISKHIQKLDSSMIAKNERGYKIVLRSGVLKLAHNLGNQRFSFARSPKDFVSLSELQRSSFLFSLES